MESIDCLYDGSIRLVQAQKGYRFSLDPVLLADFVGLAAPRQVLDLGSGCGILTLLLARRYVDARVIGWEIQAAMVGRAQRSLELSCLFERVQVVQGDVRQHAQLITAASVDLVVANPPYRQAGQGRIAPNDERATARFELNGGLRDFVAAAAFALKSRGVFALVYLAERLVELLAEMRRQGIEPKRLRMIHARQGDAAKMVLVEGMRGAVAGLKVEPPLFIYRQEGEQRQYTDEVLRIYAVPEGSSS